MAHVEAHCGSRLGNAGLQRKELATESARNSEASTEAPSLPPTRRLSLTSSGGSSDAHTEAGVMGNSDAHQEIGLTEEEGVLRTPTGPGGVCLESLRAVAIAVAQGEDQDAASNASEEVGFLRTPVGPGGHCLKSLQAVAATVAQRGCEDDHLSDSEDAPWLRTPAPAAYDFRSLRAAAAAASRDVPATLLRQ